MAERKAKRKVAATKSGTTGQSYSLGNVLPMTRGAKTASAIFKITPDMAEYWIIQYEYRGQRPYRDYWVATLAEELSKGKFHSGTQIRFSKGENGDYHLMDGQHRLMAIVESEVAIEATLTLNKTNDVAEEAMLYSDLDRGLVRTPTDGYRAMDLQTDTNLTGMQIRAMHSAVGLMYQGFAYNKGKLPVGDTADWIMQWHTYGHQYFEAIAGGEKKIVGALLRGIPTAVGLITTRWCRDKSLDFWHQTAHDEGLLKGDPRKTLNRWLADHTGKQQDQAISKVIKSPRHFALFLQKAWDAHHTGRTVKSLRVLDFTLPIRFKGCPYDSAKRGFGL